MFEVEFIQCMSELRLGGLVSLHVTKSARSLRSEFGVL